jgi:hypothetical protein
MHSPTGPVPQPFGRGTGNSELETRPTRRADVVEIRRNGETDKRVSAGERDLFHV